MDDVVEEMLMTVNINTLFPAGLVCKLWNRATHNVWIRRRLKDFDNDDGPSTRPNYRYIFYYTSYTSRATYGSEKYLSISHCLHRDIINDEYELFVHHHRKLTSKDTITELVLVYAAVLGLTKYLNILDPKRTNVKVYYYAVLFGHTNIADEYIPKIRQQLEELHINSDWMVMSKGRKSMAPISFELSNMLSVIKGAHQLQKELPLWLHPYSALLESPRITRIDVIDHNLSLSIIQLCKDGVPYDEWKDDLQILMHHWDGRTSTAYPHRIAILNFLLKESPINECTEHVLQFMLYSIRVGDAKRIELLINASPNDALIHKNILLNECRLYKNNVSGIIYAYYTSMSIAQKQV